MSGVKETTTAIETAALALLVGSAEGVIQAARQRGARLEQEPKLLALQTAVGRGRRALGWIRQEGQP